MMFGVLREVGLSFHPLQGNVNTLLLEYLLTLSHQDKMVHKCLAMRLRANLHDCIFMSESTFSGIIE